MKTQPYFQTTVNRGSIEECEKRVTELVSSGFEVVRYYENTVESRSGRTGLVSNRKVIKHDYDAGSSRSTYGAILRRPNARTSK